MSKRNNCAKISDIRNILRALKKVKERDSKIKFSKVSDKDDHVVVGIGEASFKSEEKAVGGVLLFLANTWMTRASPIYGKAKTISIVCHCSKDVETTRRGSKSTSLQTLKLRWSQSHLQNRLTGKP